MQDIIYTWKILAEYLQKNTYKNTISTEAQSNVLKYIFNWTSALLSHNESAIGTMLIVPI